MDRGCRAFRGLRQSALVVKCNEQLRAFRAFRYLQHRDAFGRGVLQRKAGGPPSPDASRLTSYHVESCDGLKPVDTSALDRETHASTNQRSWPVLPSPSTGSTAAEQRRVEGVALS